MSLQCNIHVYHLFNSLGSINKPFIALHSFVKFLMLSHALKSVFMMPISPMIRKYKRIYLQLPSLILEKLYFTATVLYINTQSWRSLRSAYLQTHKSSQVCVNKQRQKNGEIKINQNRVIKLFIYRDKTKELLTKHVYKNNLPAHKI